jgi:uncharacterized protein YdaU (DUF1376 family)
MSRAWMPLYIGDYLADTQHLTTTQHGAYLLLIMYYWQHGGLPDDEDQLRRIVKLPKQYRNGAKSDKEWRSICLAIASLFQPGWKHKRIDAELEKARVLSEKRAVLGAIGGRQNAGMNNAQRHLRGLNGPGVPKAKVAQSHKKDKKEGADEKKGGISSELEATVKAKGWA